MSALPLKADIATAPRNVSFVPKTDSCSAAKGRLIRSPRWRGRAGAVAHRDHRFGGFELVHALPAIDHAHTLLGTACISSASAALKLRSPGAAPLYWPRRTTTRACDGMIKVHCPPAPDM